MQRIWQFDDYTHVIEIISASKVKRTWLTNDKNIIKTPPKSIKTKYLNEINEMNSIIKQIEKTITLQKNRLDKIFLINRFMDINHFNKYYIIHPLMTIFTQVLIWNFHFDDTVESAIFHNDNWINAYEKKININDAREVSLWHPINSDLETIQKWRETISKNEIKQAFKQAFREVYIVTDAEKSTDTYSLRMASHILKQNQFGMLTKLRNWNYSMMGVFYNSKDKHIAELDIESYNIKAEFTLERIDAQVNNFLICDYVTTNELKFIDKNNSSVLKLDNIDKIVFSEVMRDIDLFVGVSSIGSDPMWIYGDNSNEHREYWNNYSFGKLSEIAKTRKDTLKNIIPKLKISEACSIEGNFLIIEGKIRKYKIHIGSTNILMYPNDEYLCIVADKTKKDNTNNLFIPFDDDTAISIIISKAFLLYDDDKITDKTIVSQIRRSY